MKKINFSRTAIAVHDHDKCFCWTWNSWHQKQPAEENGLILTKQNIINRMEGKEEILHTILIGRVKIILFF